MWWILQKKIKILQEEKILLQKEKNLLININKELINKCKEYESNFIICKETIKFIQDKNHQLSSELNRIKESYSEKIY